VVASCMSREYGNGIMSMSTGTGSTVHKDLRHDELLCVSGMCTCPLVTPVPLGCHPGSVPHISVVTI
jgi:hypothetical protein